MTFSEWWSWVRAPWTDLSDVEAALARHELLIREIKETMMADLHDPPPDPDADPLPDDDSNDGHGGDTLPDDDGEG